MVWDKDSPSFFRWDELSLSSLSPNFWRLFADFWKTLADVGIFLHDLLICVTWLYFINLYVFQKDTDPIGGTPTFFTGCHDYGRARLKLEKVKGPTTSEKVLI